MRIVLDAMGSDNYPKPEVHAAVEAAELRRRGGLRSLKEALTSPGASIIAECKRASPSVW